MFCCRIDFSTANLNNFLINQVGKMYELYNRYNELEKLLICVFKRV